MCKEKQLSWDEIEDSPDCAQILSKIVAEASRRAIAEAKSMGIDICYLRDYDIVLESPTGVITVIGHIPEKPMRKVKKGSTAWLR